MENKNIWLIPFKEEPTKGDLLLRHIWKGTPNECRSLWQYDETITIDEVKQYTTLNGSFRDYYKSFRPQYLYITSKDPYSKGDWVKNITIELEPPFKLDAHGIRYTQISPCKFEKVILTTDHYLIEDKVQVIPDNFLEWFLKNHTSSFINIESYHGVNTSIAEISAVSGNDEYNWKGQGDFRDYRVIFPKELSKCTCERPDDNTCDHCEAEESKRILEDAKKRAEQHEVVQEVAKRMLANNIDGLRDALKDDDLFFFYKGVVQIYGETMAEWQREQTEEESLCLIQFLSTNEEFNSFSSVSLETAKLFLDKFNRNKNAK